MIDFITRYQHEALTIWGDIDSYMFLILFVVLFTCLWCNLLILKFASMEWISIFNWKYMTFVFHHHVVVMFLWSKVPSFLLKICMSWSLHMLRVLTTLLFYGFYKYLLNIIIRHVAETSASIFICFLYAFDFIYQFFLLNLTFSEIEYDKEHD
jgi:hypothetical protein